MSTSSLVLCYPLLPSSNSLAAPSSFPSIPAPSQLNSGEPGGLSRTHRTAAESRARAMARLRHRSCSAARSCPPPLARSLPRPTPSSCWSLPAPSELNGNEPGGSSRAFGLCARALDSGCIRGRRMHLFDDGSSYGCTRRTEAAQPSGCSKTGMDTMLGSLRLAGGTETNLTLGQENCEL